MSEAAPLAAVDLGSNSFHMIVARPGAGGFEVIDRLREAVRLAGGMNQSRELDPAARERALACLARFGERLRGIESGRVRAVGTNTLRRMREADNFIAAAEQALGHPIEVISGIEEARLIYGAVSRELPPEFPGRLVVDIGGGSTEVIAGHADTPHIMESFSLGCVALTERFFTDGKVTRKRWQAAQLQVRQELEPYELALRRQGWDVAVGASGTIRAIQRVIEAHGWCVTGVDAAGLDKLVRRLLKAGSLEAASLKSLSERRRQVFMGGLVVLAGLFDALGIERMEVSDSALREGLLLDLMGRLGDHDQRPASVRAMVHRLGVDTAQAERVRTVAADAFDQVAASWGLGGWRHYLDWAAELHEVGRAIAHDKHHKHGAYIVENADLGGFSRTEQKMLAVLILCQRGKLKPARLAGLPPPWRDMASRLAVLLRIAVVLHRRRDPDLVPAFMLSAEGGAVDLRFPPGWLSAHPLTRSDLEREQSQMAKDGVELHFA